LDSDISGRISGSRSGLARRSPRQRRGRESSSNASRRSRKKWRRKETTFVHGFAGEKFAPRPNVRYQPGESPQFQGQPSTRRSPKLQSRRDIEARSRISTTISVKIRRVAEDFSDAFERSPAVSSHTSIPCNSPQCSYKPGQALWDATSPSFALLSKARRRSLSWVPGVATAPLLCSEPLSRSRHPSRPRSPAESKAVGGALRSN